MGVLKNDVGRPSKKTKIIRGILKLIGILIIVAAGLYIGYVIGNNQNKEEDNNSKIEEKEESKENEVKEQDKEDLDLMEAEDIVKSIFGDQYKADMHYLGYYNDDTNIFNKDFYKTLTAIRNTNKTDKYSCEDVYNTNNENYYCDGVYDYNDVNLIYNKLFKTGNPMKSSMNDLSWFDIKYDYSKEKNVYTILKQDNGDLNFFVAGIYKAYKIGDNVYITIAFNHFDYSEEMDTNEFVTLKLNDGTTINNYKMTYEDNENPNIYGLYSKELISDYGSNMENYELEFEELDGRYVFVNSEKIK